MEDKITERIATLCASLYSQEVVVGLERPQNQFGDYATNIAMHLAKPLGRSPRDIAQELAQELAALDMFASVGVAGPGFINMTLQDTVLLAQINQPAHTPYSHLQMVVEYSDPNPFKPLHAGHLYTTLVGDVIARLLVRAGAKVQRLNFGGDVGLHVAKTMWSITQELGSMDARALQDISEDDRAVWMGARYAEGHSAYLDDPDAKAAITALNKAVYAIHTQQDHDSDLAKVYWTCREWSYEYFKSFYTQLAVHPFDRFIPESEVTPLGVATVRAQLQSGVFAESNGAIVFHGEQEGLHTRVFINSEGLPTYETKDVGLSLTKWNDYKFDESIIITAEEQGPYMQVVLAAIHHFAPEAAARTKHITHGTVKLTGGVKMSSRKGTAVLALDIIDAAHLAAQSAEKQMPESSVLAAVKYSFLKNRVGTDMIYDPNESVSLDGNSGPYLQYAYARASSILAKVDVKNNKVVSEHIVLDQYERLLARQLSMYQEAVWAATQESSPHHICSYLYELSQTFNRFYENSKVIDHERQDIRTALVASYKSTLFEGLQLLGIEAPEVF